MHVFPPAHKAPLLRTRFASNTVVSKRCPPCAQGLSLEAATALFLGEAWAPVYLVLDRQGEVLSAEVPAAAPAARPSSSLLLFLLAHRRSVG